MIKIIISAVKATMFTLSCLINLLSNSMINVTNVNNIMLVLMLITEAINKPYKG